MCLYLFAMHVLFLLLVCVCAVFCESQFKPCTSVTPLGSSQYLGSISCHHSYLLGLLSRLGAPTVGAPLTLVGNLTFGAPFNTHNMATSLPESIFDCTIDQLQAKLAESRAELELAATLAKQHFSTSRAPYAIEDDNRLLLETTQL